VDAHRLPCHRAPAAAFAPSSHLPYVSVIVEDSLILEVLKRMQADVAALRHDVGVMRVPMSAIEDHQRCLITSLGGIKADLDQLNTRVARIERRLDIVEA
jgi:hypothetical protein